MQALAVLVDEQRDIAHGRAGLHRGDEVGDRAIVVLGHKLVGDATLGLECILAGLQHGDREGHSLRMRGGKLGILVTQYRGMACRAWAPAATRQQTSKYATHSRLMQQNQYDAGSMLLGLHIFAWP